MAGSSSASNIFFKGDGQPQPPANSQLNSSFGNSPSSISGTSRSNLVPGSLDTNRISNRAANSGPSVAASSLVTDANSALSGGGPHLQRSASINAESYLRVPASPMSYSSNNNISISGSSVMDGSCIAQQSSNQDQRQQQKGGSTFTSQTAQQAGQVSASLSQDTANLLQMQKRPRLDVRQEDILQQQVIQQLLRQDSMQLQGHNPHLQALIQQQRLVQRQQQQQQMLQSMPQIQRAHIQQQQQQQQQQQLRQQLQQQSVALPSKRSYDSGVCSRRLMQYIYHQRHRPSDNNILYWRKFVAEYFAPRAKKRWCLSLYDNVGHHTLGVFPQAAMDVWQCDICQSKTGRGFEATSEVLPRLNKIKFDSGVVDELLFVDMPHESRSPSGIMILEYGKAVQESVYEQLRVVREGRLRIIFNPDLKILSWEFCAQRHEELLPRRLIAPQVSQLVTAAQKCQTAAKESESAGFSPRDMQTNYNMFLTAGCQLAKNLESQSLNDLGFSKRYVRCLQISEVVSSMKDLIDFSREQRIGPIDSLKSYPRQVAAAKLQTQRMQEMEQLVNAQGLPTDQNALNKIMNIHPCLNSHMNTNQIGGVTNNAAQNAIALTNYRNLLRQHSMNSNPNTIQQDASCSSIGSDQSRSLPSQNPPVSPVGGSLQTTSISGLSTPHQRQHSVNANLQSDVIQQLLQEMMSSNGGVQPQQTLSGQNSNGNGTEDIFVGANGTGVRASISSTVGNGLGFGNNIKISNNVMGMIPGRGKSLAVSSNAINSRPELPSQDLHMPDLVQDISNEFAENAFDSEPGEMGFNWKA